MRQLNQRIAKPSQFDSLVKGDIVTLNDDGTVNKSIWQGRYVWYPAGSQVPVTAMYARWNDSLVALTRAQSHRRTAFAQLIDRTLHDDNDIRCEYHHRCEQRADRRYV